MDKNEYQREWHAANADKINTRRRDRVRERRQILAQLKAERGCKHCGENDIRCLHFHHRDPGEKLFCIGQAVRGRSIEILLAEVEKCDVLCANCHEKHHHKEVQHD